MATPTGRTLYLATTSGIYGFSIMSDGTLSAVSSSPLATGSYNQIAATTGTSPMLIGANGGTSLTTWSLSGGGLGTQGSISLSGCSSFSATGVTVASDNSYIFVVSGSATTSSNIGSIRLGGSGCTPLTASSIPPYPIQPALDCSQGGTNSCVLFLTMSSQYPPLATTYISPTEYTYTEGGSSITSSTAPSCTTSNCPVGVAFNPNTLDFYATFNGTTPSLQSFAPATSSSIQTTTFSTGNLNLPCIDALGGVAYIPTSNGYVYSVSTANGGGLGSPSTVLSPQTFGTTLNISSCAVAGS